MCSPSMNISVGTEHGRLLRKMCLEIAFQQTIDHVEFGAEALYGNHRPKDAASSWSEEYQEQVYKDQVSMFRDIPFCEGRVPGC